jgi:hypothetical protein
MGVRKAARSGCRRAIVPHDRSLESNTWKGIRNMGTSASKDKAPFDPHPYVHARALPKPYQLAIEDVPFQMTVLDNHVSRDRDCTAEVRPPTWFSVTLTAPIEKRYLYLVQKETDTGRIVLIMLFDRTGATDEPIRLPPSGA